MSDWMSNRIPLLFFVIFEPSVSKNPLPKMGKPPQDNSTLFHEKAESSAHDFFSWSVWCSTFFIWQSLVLNPLPKLGMRPESETLSNWVLERIPLLDVVIFEPSVGKNSLP